MKKIFLPIVLCVLMAISSLLLACTPIGEHTHQFEWKEEVAATCGKDGIQAHNVCTVCGYWFDKDGNKIDEKDCVIPATGKHTFKDGKCTVCGAPDPEWKGDEPNPPAYQFEWLKGEWKQEDSSTGKPWELKFDGTTLTITYLKTDELATVNATSFKATSDTVVTYTLEGYTEGTFTITKISDMRITVVVGTDSATLTKQNVEQDPTAEYAKGMEALVKEQGFWLQKYEIKDTEYYVEFISGKQVKINYNYTSSKGQPVKINGTYNISYAENCDPDNPTSTWYIFLSGMTDRGYNENRIAWSGPNAKTGTYDWTGADGSDIVWMQPAFEYIFWANRNFTLVEDGEGVEFPDEVLHGADGETGLSGVWDYYGDSITERYIIDAEKGTATRIYTTNYPGQPQSTTTSELKFTDCIKYTGKGGDFYMIRYTFGENSSWLRYNPYNNKLISSPATNQYRLYEQQDPNMAIPYAGELPADLKGEYTSAADGKYAFDGKNVVFTPAQGDAVNYVVTNVEDGESETTKKITIALKDQKDTTIVFTYDLVKNTLTDGAKVFTGENLYLTGATNLPTTLTGTYMYDGTDVSDWRYTFDGYKVTSREASGEEVKYYATAYATETHTLTLTQVTDLNTGHKVNDGSEPLTVTFIYSDTENTLTINGDSANPSKVFRSSAVNPEVVLPEDLNGTYYAAGGKTNYVDILNYNATLAGFADTKLNGEFEIVGFDSDSGVITLSAKDQSVNGKDPVTLTLSESTLTYNTTTVLTKGRPVKFTGEFYSRTAKYIINGDDITEVKLDGTETVYTIKSEKEERSTTGDKNYGWTISASKKDGSYGSLSMWYEYLGDGCKTNYYATGSLSIIRLPASSTAGVPASSAGTYILLNKGSNSANITIYTVVVDFEEATISTYSAYINATGGETSARYFIDRYDGQNKQIIAKFGATEYKFGFDEENPDEIIDVGSSNRVLTKKIDVTTLPQKLQASGSFFGETETIAFNMETMVVTATAAKTGQTSGSGSSANVTYYYFAKYDNGTITLVTLDYTHTKKEFYYDEANDNIKKAKEDADVYAVRPIEAAEGVEMLRGTFKKDDTSIIFDGTAYAIIKEGTAYKQGIVKAFDKEAGKITLLTVASGDVEYTYDAKASTLTAGADVYTIDNLPVGLDGTYKTTDGKQIDMYMGCIIITISSVQYDVYTVAWENNSQRTTLYCTPDNNRSHSGFQLTVSADHKQLTNNSDRVNGTYIKEETAEPEPTFSLEWLKGDWVEAVATDAKWTVSFDGENLTVNFTDHGITKNIEATSFEAISETEVTFKAKDYQPGSKITKVNDTISVQLSGGAGGVTGLVKKSEQQEPEFPDLEGLSGKYFYDDGKVYTFDGVNVTAEDFEGKVEKYTITASTNGTFTLTPSESGSAKTMYFKEGLLYNNSTSTSLPNGRPVPATVVEIPELTGSFVNEYDEKYVFNGTYRILAYFSIPDVGDTLTGQWVIIKYDEGTGEIELFSAGAKTEENTVKGTFLKATPDKITINFGEYIKETEEEKPSFTLPEGLKGEFYFSNMTYTFNGGVNVDVSVVGGKKTVYTIIECTADTAGVTLKFDKNDGKGGTISYYYNIKNDKIYLATSKTSLQASRKPENVVETVPFTGSYVYHTVTTYDITETYTFDGTGYVVYLNDRTRLSDQTQTTRYNQYFVTACSDTSITLHDCSTDKDTTLTYDKESDKFTNTKKNEYIKAIEVPEQFNGIYVSKDRAYIFDGTVNVIFRNLDGSKDKYVIIEATNEEGNITVTVQSVAEPETTIKFTYSENSKGTQFMATPDGKGMNKGYKNVPAENFAKEIVGSWIAGDKSTAEFSEDGFVVFRDSSGASPQLYLITDVSYYRL